MSRTTMPDGSVRYAPDRGHRSQRRMPTGERLAAAAIPLAVGAVGLRGVGLQAGLVIAGITAVVTVAGVLVWRRTMPDAVSVTVTGDAVTYRRYGRTASVVRNANLRALRRVLRQGPSGLTTPYLVLAGDGGGFILNADHWTDDDLAGIAAAASVQDPSGREVSTVELRDEAPGALPLHVARPNVMAILFILGLIVVLLVVMTVAALVSTGSIDQAT